MVANLYTEYKGMERRVVTVMVKTIRENIEDYPKLHRWLNRPFATQQVKVYMTKIRKDAGSKMRSFV